MKILFLQKRPLFPANTGGKIRTLNVVRHLAKWHDVTYLCNVLPEEEPHLPSMSDLGVELITIPWTEAPRNSPAFYGGLAKSLLSRFPFTANKDFDPRIRSQVMSLVREGNFDLLICDFVQSARNVLGIENVPKLLFQHNVEAQIYRRMADNESNPLKRWFIRNQQRKMETFESSAGRDFDRVVAVSEQDKRSFHKAYDWEHVDVIDTAVDTEYFCSQERSKQPGKLVFVGSMDWLPNEEGVLRFVDRVLPIIQQRQKNVSIDIVGRNPSAKVQALQSVPGVHVTGSVEDVRPYVDDAEIAIVPLYAGGGTRLKIFEFMAMGTPVVSTAIGAEGLDIQVGEHWICADTDEEFSNAVCHLLSDIGKRNELSKAAQRHVHARYSSEVVARQFEAICQMTAKVD